MSFIRDIVDSIEQATADMIASVLPASKPDDTIGHDNHHGEFGTHQEEHGLSSGITVNGVALPMNVAQQLRELGHPLEHYSPQELQAAIHACAVDGRLIDDPHGTSFHDMLTLEAHEEHGEHHGGGALNYRMRGTSHTPAEKTWTARVEQPHLSGSAQSFCERLLHEREHEMDEHAQHKQGNGSI